QRNQIGIAAIVEPAPPRHELVAKITEMRDRAAERGQPEPQEGRQHLRPGSACRLGSLRGDFVHCRTYKPRFGTTMSIPRSAISSYLVDIQRMSAHAVWITNLCSQCVSAAKGRLAIAATAWQGRAPHIGARTMAIYELDGGRPDLHPRHWIAESASVI